ncbi:hypothetical protein FQA39_LY11015 [Lamprigera yunnana]|nr:hypothetical protein FQA39_LY11015 [Lamprigera yunnana]
MAVFNMVCRNLQVVNNQYITPIMGFKHGETKITGTTGDRSSTETVLRYSLITELVSTGRITVTPNACDATYTEGESAPGELAMNTGIRQVPLLLSGYLFISNVFV